MPPWRAKVVAQQVFSRIPGGHRLNYVFQRHVTHGLPISDASLLDVVAIAGEHIRGLERHSRIRAEDAQFFEFGAGWDLHVAQVLSCFGAGRQLVVDIRPLLRSDLVLDIRDRLATLDAPLPRRPPRGDTSLDSYLDAIGIDYRAPCDARATGLQSGSVDFVTSTNTLEHIPRDDIRRILDESRRVLSDDGAMSFQIDYKDHYSYFDSRLTAYNFLRFDEREWKRFNPALHFQNRLRHSDYLTLFAESGLEVADATVEAGSSKDREAIERLDVAVPFRTYTVEDLAVRKSVVVLTK